MPSDTLNFHIAGIGPSDVQAEIKSIEGVVSKLSREFLTRNVTLSFHHWSLLAPGVGTPQGYIDGSINWERMDFVVGAMYKKFGSPVDDADSGTEHECNEILRLSQRGQPDLLFYFRDRGSAKDGDVAKIENFRRALYKKALVGTYGSKRDFIEQVEVAIRNKVNAKLSAQEQTQRRMGRLPVNRSLSVEFVVFSEIPERGQTPVIIVLKDSRGRYFFLDTRYTTGQMLADWIAQSMGFAVTEGMTLMEYLMENNTNNIRANNGISQLWLGNIIFADYPNFKVRDLKIAIGKTNTHEGKLGWDLKDGAKISLELPSPQIIVEPDGSKKLRF